MTEQVIRLKWGTLKGWEVSKENKPALELLQKYHDLGACGSAAYQQDTDEQKQILIDLISLPDMKVYLDWDGKYVTPEEGAEYIRNYGAAS